MAPVLGTSKQPRYARVADALMSDIAGDTYPVGALLPPESVLCEHFQVSRATVREALRQLSELGVVIKEHGIGTRVIAKETQTNYLMSLDSVSGLMHYGTKTLLKVMNRKPFVAAEADLPLLHCAVGDRWIRIRGLRSIVGDEKRPIACSDIYINERFADVAYGPTPTCVYYELIMEQYGEELQSVEQEISAIDMKRSTAELLGVKAGSSGLQIVRRYHSSRQQPIEVTLNHHPKDRFTYRLLVNRPSAK